jgi:hypothetical protein
LGFKDLPQKSTLRDSWERQAVLKALAVTRLLPYVVETLMKAVVKTDEYTIYQRRDERYAVEGANKKSINGDEKAAILSKHELIKVTLPAPVEEAVEEVEEVEAEAPAAEAPAEEAPSAEEAPAAEEEPATDEEPKED